MHETSATEGPRYEVSKVASRGLFSRGSPGLLLIIVGKVKPLPFSGNDMCQFREFEILRHSVCLLKFLTLDNRHKKTGSLIWLPVP